MDERYKGWRITYDPNRPATSTWVAERFGVTINNRSEAELKRMIDTRPDYVLHAPEWRVGDKVSE